MRGIDAEAVIQKLEELQARCVADGSLVAGATHQIIQWCIDIIMQQPTVETVKTGRWVKKRRMLNGKRIETCNENGVEYTIEHKLGYYDEFYCSECGAVCSDSWNNYCGKCGLKMEGMK